MSLKSWVVRSTHHCASGVFKHIHPPVFRTPALPWGKHLGWKYSLWAGGPWAQLPFSEVMERRHYQQHYQGHRKKALSASLSRKSMKEEWTRHGCCKVERHCGHLQRHSPGHEAWGCRECREKMAAWCRTWNTVWNIQEALLEETPAWVLTAQWKNEAHAVISEPIGGSSYPTVCHA